MVVHEQNSSKESKYFYWSIYVSVDQTEKAVEKVRFILQEPLELQGMIYKTCGVWCRTQCCLLRI